MQTFLNRPVTIVRDPGDALLEPLEVPRQPYMPDKPSLIYLICFDAPNSESNRYLAKMLVSSLLCTFCTGDIIVFRSPYPIQASRAADQLFQW